MERGRVDLAARAAPVVSDKSNIQQIGELLYTRYIFLFEAAGIVLLVAMIGAIVLTHRKRGGVRTQNISKQNQRRPQDATRLVDPGVGQGDGIVISVGHYLAVSAVLFTLGVLGIFITARILSSS